MLFTRLETALKTIAHGDPAAGPRTLLLVYNDGLAAWALLDLDRSLDHSQYFDDPRNTGICVITSQDVHSLPSSFSVDAAERVLTEYARNVRVPVAQIGFSLLIAELCAPPNSTQELPV